jgi:uncharacterized protein YbcI
MSTTASDADLSAALRPVFQRFERFYLGRSSREVEIGRCGNLIVFHCQGSLTDAESRLLQADPTPDGREMVAQLFRKMVRQAQESFTGAVESTLSVTVRSLFCDLDPEAGESVIVLAIE